MREGVLKGVGLPQHSFGAEIADQKVQVRPQSVHQNILTWGCMEPYPGKPPVPLGGLRSPILGNKQTNEQILQIHSVMCYLLFVRWEPEWHDRFKGANFFVRLLVV